ncbi:MAG: hemerythrin domain-containing protein [Lentisphaerae bacterium]|nr:hemerythrin domain-containing protein [Lentisphaerota bacterium]
MQARGPLMIEHRLIERILPVAKNVLDKIKSTGKADSVFVDKIADFIRIYADQIHHGKEEDILFRCLDKKPLSAIDRKVMKELIEEHVFGRQTTKGLVDANMRYRNGDTAALSEIADKLQILINFYSKHIEKEDKMFFPAAQSYLSDQENQAMLAEFREFDGKMIHKQYKALVAQMEQTK